MMKANKFSNEEAQVGIGTMIVFIATILVAAVAAGVLIDTSQKLQDKSTQTGTAATQSVGTSLDVFTVYGKRDLTTGDLVRLEVWIQLAAGSDAVDLDELIVSFENGTAKRLFAYDDNDLTSAISGGADAEFIVYDSDGTAKSTDRVIQAGERHMILIGQDSLGDGTSLNLTTSSNVGLELVPDVGVTVGAGFKTPATYNQNKVFELF